MKKINIFKFSIFHAVIFAIVGLIAGILYSFGGAIYDILVSVGWIVSNETPGLSYGTLLAFGALIGMPIIFAMIGLVLGLIEAIIYNLFSKWISWLKPNFEQDSDSK